MGSTKVGIEHHKLGTAMLMRAHPQVWRYRNKHVVFDIAGPPGCEYRGTVRYSGCPIAAGASRAQAKSRPA